MNQPPRHAFAFALIDMVIVILVSGIVVAVVAPRLFDRSSETEERITRQQLAVLRQAIEIHVNRSGDYPAADALPTALAPILDGPFPAPAGGSVRGDHRVHYDLSQDLERSVQPDPGQPGGWAYKPANGSLKLNVEASQAGADW